MDSLELRFEKEHMEEMRRQTQLLEQQNGILQSILEFKKEKWEYEKARDSQKK